MTRRQEHHDIHKGRIAFDNQRSHVQDEVIRRSSRGARCGSKRLFFAVALLLFMFIVSTATATDAEPAASQPKVSMGVAQKQDGTEFGVDATELQEKLDSRKKYFQNDVVGVLTQPQIDRCQDLDELCAIWSLQGECQSNEDFMDQHCALSCQVCDKVLPDADLCFYVDSGPDIWQAGDLDRMFRRIVKEYDNVQVLSSPDDGTMRTTEDGSPAETPWVLVIDDFLTTEEAKRLIELGALEGYDRSTLAEREDEEDDLWRTSTNSWCQDQCHGDEVYEQVMERMVDMTEIPRDHAEDMQMLRYEPGQFYKVHHDFIENEDMAQKGCRLITVFLYLNDVGQGGATGFPELNLTVTPKTGRALIWPSVLNDDPRAINWGTEHEAQIVEKGEKYGANVWFHMKPLQKAWTQFECCEHRKTFADNEPLLWEEDDLDFMFRRIVDSSDYKKDYNTTILSSPSTDGPWILTMQNFITPEEAAALVAAGTEAGYEKSKLGTGGTLDNERRSSTTVFCMDECAENEVVKEVTERIAELTGITEEYSEYMQLLRYETGQFYKEHHDYHQDLDDETESQNGNRALTVYIYLNDVEEGGETAFPSLDLVIEPELGKVIIWPSVLNDEPTEMDVRTRHEARPVTAGNKFGANLWFMYRPFRNGWRQPMCADAIEEEEEEEWDEDEEAEADEAEL